MPFNTPSLPALITRAQGDLAGSSALLRSDAEVLARVNGAASYGRYGHQAYIAEQILPDTADEDTLRRMARARLKRDQLPAVAAQGPVGFIGSAGRVLDAGTLLRRDDGQQFRVLLTVTLTGAAGVAQLQAVTPGQAGNTPAGTTLRTVSPVLGISDTFTVQAPGLTAGSEQESLEALRARVVRSYRLVPHGGNKTDYETWALEVPGVTRAWLIRHWAGPGTVAVFIARDGDINLIPSPEALQQAFDYIESECPVTVELYVLAPVEKPVQYEIKLTPDSSSIRSAVEAELVDLHKRESNLGVGLLLTHIRAAISGAPGETDHQLLNLFADVPAARNELLTFGGILWR